MSLMQSKTKEEVFKGSNVRFLIPFEEQDRNDGPGHDSSGSNASDQSNMSEDIVKGFDDTVTTSDGNAGDGSGRFQQGGIAKGKSRLAAAKNIRERANKECRDPNTIANLQSFKDEVKAILKEAVQKAKQLKKNQKKMQYTVHPLVLQKPHETEHEVALGDPNVYAKIHSSVRKEIEFIKKRLFRLVSNKQYVRWYDGADKGKRLSRKNLPRIKTGCRDIFKYKEESDVRDIAFSLLIDESGSMWGDKTEQARRCAVMFSEILNVLKIPFEVVGYTTCGLTEEQRQRQSTIPASNEAYNRSDNLQHNIYKRFDDRFQAVKTKLARIDANSCNYDQDHVEFAWNRLKERPEKRKVLIVISDGQPCGGTEAREKLKRVVNEIGCDKDAEVIGIGIHTDYVKDFYHKCVEIKNVSQLGMNVVRLISSAIEKKTIKAGLSKATAEPEYDLY